ncbi:MULTISPECIES: helix-turn-helix transcriptional regulator [Gordonibacter]|uniref:Helix-turn-helix transcriptional regulator n=1 Tax=Gordonibacter faecis TaxID=3047475 RepID=A0ABT7DQK4_9ACTN|nr:MULTISPECIES: helix-turn-helix transcriptional regulator [unclassified Gordonibacter]MDJ1651821.1 helix-turn-helix transcriptional regulator [Gordonibacter sp. KGMB12511]HIW75645.1 helix-turn-helix domain-containing protein [Candidatus Gordonibacter avicola]
MGFRENLQYLRGTRDMSQTELAQLLGVSRQSVAKWEAEKSYPEMDKLIAICDLFECTLDELVRRDLTGSKSELVVREAGAKVNAEVAREDETEDETAPEVEPTANVTSTDTWGYDEHMRRRAWDYAVGLAAVVLSIGVGLFVSHSDLVTGLVPFFIAMGAGVGVALLLMVPGYTGHQLFMREHPRIEDFYTAEQKSEARRRKAFGIAGGVVLAIAGLNMPGLFSVFHMQTFSSLGLFLCLAAAAGLLAYAIMMDHRIDVTRYNAAAPTMTAEDH